MAYILPRAVIVLIAWGTACLFVNTFPTIAPQVFYVAASVWSLVGLACFGYMHSFGHSFGNDTDVQPAPALVKVQSSVQ